MNKENHRQILEQAARPTLERIRRDGENAPERLRILFAYLEQHLFERGLDVNQMKRACGKRNNSVSCFFAEATGQTPHAYIVARRVETAAALLRDTDLEIRSIAKLVGFSKHGLLTCNFKACHRMTPRDFRLFSRRQHHDFPKILPDNTPRRREEQKTCTFSLTAEKREKIKSEALWEILKDKPWAVQRAMIRSQIAFSTPAFFHFLRKKSVSEGRNQRDFGIHLAELALECLRVTEQVTGKDLMELRAQGWSWLANARRLADDLSGAEAAFSIAEVYLASEGSLVQAEYFSQKATLRLWQGKIDEASELIGRSLSIFRAKGTPTDIIRSLIVGAIILERVGNDHESVIHLKEALNILSSHPEPYLELVARFNLANAYIQNGSFENAIQMLPQLRELREASQAEEACLYHIHWLEGRIRDGLCDLSAAANSYQAARAGLLRLGKDIDAAIVSLDLDEIACWA